MAKKRQITRNTSVDWREVVFNLYTYGQSKKDIADQVGVSSQSVGYWRDGLSRPGYENGVVLLGLWQMIVKLDYRHIPKTGKH